jgi:hypothetical protein
MMEVGESEMADMNDEEADYSPKHPVVAISVS